MSCVAGVSAEAARQAAAFACLHYRKPKRIRTAFSPTQLVRLEDAFDSNQYVVGQERKDLAASLSLTETQVIIIIIIIRQLIRGRNMSIKSLQGWYACDDSCDIMTSKPFQFSPLFLFFIFIHYSQEMRT